MDYNPLLLLKPPELKKLTFTASFTEEAELKVSSKVNLLDFKKEKELARYVLSAIDIQVGPVPVVVVPTITLIGGVSAEAAISLETGITQRFTCTAWASYAGGLWNPISSSSNQFTYTPPTLSASAELKAYIQPELSLMVYTLAGPYASLNGYLELAADTSADPWWTLYGGLDGKVGVKVEVFGKKLCDWGKDFTLLRKLLASAQPKPVQKWQRTFGGTDDDLAHSVQQTRDGGYILAGETVYFGAGGFDAYLVKTDASGNLLWQRNFGGTSGDSAESVQLTSDGGYILAGITESFGAGGGDAYLIKTDASGNLLWQRTFGGTDYDGAYSVQQTSEGGYILAGYTCSFGAGVNDAYLVKTDASGNL